MDIIFRTEGLAFAYGDPTLNEAIVETIAEFPGLAVVPTGVSVVGCGWPEVKLVGTLPVLLAALAKWDSGDAEQDLEFTREVLKTLEVF